MAIRLHRRLLLLVLLPILAADIAFGRFLSDPAEHHYHFKWEVDDIILRNVSDWKIAAWCAAAYLVM